MNMKKIAIYTSIFATIGATPLMAAKQMPQGWATKATGFVDFIKAEQEKVFTVKNREEFIKALAHNGPKTIYVDGIIDGTPKTADQYLLEAGFKPKHPDKEIYWGQFYGLNPDGTFVPGGYLATYAPETYGKNDPKGELEEIRDRAAKLQKRDITIDIPSNTKIIGVGANSGFEDVEIAIKKAENVVIRNLNFTAVIDFFPGWDPKDGANGNWNSEYDTLTISESTAVWIDGNMFTDSEEYADYNAPYLYGRLFQRHDGLLDIVRESDLITVSNNIFQNHSKTMVWGNSDGRKSDEGKIRVSFYGNHLKNISERAPRVRYGKVHLFNNFYEGEISESGKGLVEGEKKYFLEYTIGNGVEAKVYAQGNVFEYESKNKENDPTKRLLKEFKGTRFYDEDSIVNGKPLKISDNMGKGAAMEHVPVDTDVKWNPKNEYKFNLLKSDKVKASVLKNAGPGKLKK